MIDLIVIVGVLSYIVLPLLAAVKKLTFAGDNGMYMDSILVGLSSLLAYLIADGTYKNDNVAAKAVSDNTVWLQKLIGFVNKYDYGHPYWFIIIVTIILCLIVLLTTKIIIFNTSKAKYPLSFILKYITAIATAWFVRLVYLYVCTADLTMKNKITDPIAVTKMNRIGWIIFGVLLVSRWGTYLWNNSFKHVYVNTSNSIHSNLERQHYNKDMQRFMAQDPIVQEKRRNNEPMDEIDKNAMMARYQAWRLRKVIK